MSDFTWEGNLILYSIISKKFPSQHEEHQSEELLCVSLQNEYFCLLLSTRILFKYNRRYCFNNLINSPSIN